MQFEQWFPAFRQQLAERGLDLVWPFSVARLNASCPIEHRLPLTGPRSALLTAPHSAPVRRDALGLVVGNGRALFAPFLRSLPAPELLPPDPLDRYVEKSLERALESAPATLLIGYSHTLHPAPLPMQRYAEASGLARLGPAGLVVHPQLGPWLSLRAVVVFDLEPPAALPEPNDSPCPGCSAPCRPAFERAVAALRGAAPNELPSGPPNELVEADLPVPAVLDGRQRLFLAARDACPVGRQERFGQQQLAYHYVRDPALLR